MMLRLTLCLVALLGLAACGGDPTYAPQAEVDAVRYSPPDEPPSITLYTVINNRSGSGAHTGLIVNASERVLFDPAGTWYHPKLPIQHDVHYGMTDKAVAYYIDYHARKTFDVIEQTIVLSPEIAELVLRKVRENGAVPKSMCANSASAILRTIPGFESLPQTWFPVKLSEGFAELPGVSSRMITDDTDETNHGILLVQANGDPLE